MSNIQVKDSRNAQSTSMLYLPRLWPRQMQAEVVEAVVDEEAPPECATAMASNSNNKPSNDIHKAYPYLVVIILLIGVVCVIIGQVLSVNVPDKNEAVVAAGFLNSFGTALCTTAIVSFVADKYLRDRTVINIEGVIEKKQKEFLEKNTEFFNMTLKSSKRYGLAGFHDEMRIGGFFQTLEPKDIVYIQDTFIPGADSWIHDYKSSKKLQQVEFRFIQLNPECEAAKLRSKEVPEEAEEEYIKNMQGFSTTLKHLAARYPRSVFVQWHNGPLTIPSYLVIRNDEPLKAITSFYMRAGTVGGLFPHLEWEAAGEKKDKGFIVLLQEYVEWKWKYLMKQTQAQGASSNNVRHHLP